MGVKHRVKFISAGIFAAICVYGVQVGFALTDGAVAGPAGMLTSGAGSALQGRVYIPDEALPRKIGLPSIKRQPAETLQERLLSGREARKSS